MFISKDALQYYMNRDKTFVILSTVFIAAVLIGNLTFAISNLSTQFSHDEHDDDEHDDDAENIEDGSTQINTHTDEENDQHEHDDDD